MSTLTPRRPSVRFVRHEPVDVARVFGLDPRAGTLARGIDLRPGAFTPGAAATDARCLLLLAEGALLRSVHVGVRESAELLGPGDLVQLEPGDAGVFRTGLRALSACRLAVLDDRFMVLAAERPALRAALQEAAGRRTSGVAAQVVLTQHTSIDARLRILLPILAARWGVVTPDGVLLPAFLSHTVLAALIGVRRPSLTAALGVLADSALLARMPDRRWRLAPELGMAA